MLPGHVESWLGVCGCRFIMEQILQQHKHLPPPSTPNPSLSKALPSATWTPCLPYTLQVSLVKKATESPRKSPLQEFLGGFCCTSKRAHRAQPMSKLSFGSATRMCWRHFLHSEKIEHCRMSSPLTQIFIFAPICVHLYTVRTQGLPWCY